MPGAFLYRRTISHFLACQIFGAFRADRRKVPLSIKQSGQSHAVQPGSATVAADLHAVSRYRGCSYLVTERLVLALKAGVRADLSRPWQEVVLSAYFLREAFGLGQQILLLCLGSGCDARPVPVCPDSRLLKCKMECGIPC